MNYYNTLFYDGKGKMRELNQRTHGKYTYPDRRIFNGDIAREDDKMTFDGMTLVPTSEDVLTIEGLIGKTVVTVSDGEETTFTLTENDLIDRGLEDDNRKYIEVRPITVDENPIAICVYEDMYIEGRYYWPGVYYRYEEDKFYTKVINYFSDPKEIVEVINPIHPMYLPNRRQYGVFKALLTVYTDNSGETPVKKYRWDTDISEVDQAYKEGKLIIADTSESSEDNSNTFYCIMADPGIMYIFVEVNNAFPNIIFMSRQ